MRVQLRGEGMRGRHVSWLALVVVIVLVSSAGAMADSVTVPVNLTGYYVEGSRASTSVNLGQRFSSLTSITVQHSGTTAQSVKYNDYFPDPMVFNTYPLLCQINVSGLQNDFTGGGYRDHYTYAFPYSDSCTNPASPDYYWTSQSRYNDALLGRLDLSLLVWLNGPPGGTRGFINIESMFITVEGTFASVPEPGSLVALASGLLFAVPMVLRRRK